MKLSTTILLVSLILVTVGLFASNMALKTEYNKLDKNDKYWNYTTVLNQPFKHVKIDGGNVTQIVFEQAPTSTVRIVKYWPDYKVEGGFKAHVSGDTLYISMVYHPQKKITESGCKMHNWLGSLHRNCYLSTLIILTSNGIT